MVKTVNSACLMRKSMLGKQGRGEAEKGGSHLNFRCQPEASGLEVKETDSWFL